MAACSEGICKFFLGPVRAQRVGKHTMCTSMPCINLFGRGTAIGQMIEEAHTCALKLSVILYMGTINNMLAHVKRQWPVQSSAMHRPKTTRQTSKNQVNFTVISSTPSHKLLHAAEMYTMVPLADSLRLLPQ